MKKTANTRFYIAFMTLLLLVFGLYNFTVYTNENSKYTAVLGKEAIAGQRLWQENNCSSCHQLYGLGGYLGPDLTNIYSTKEKGHQMIKAILNSGIGTMPKFNFSENEKQSLAAFLKEVDQSGYYPNYNAVIKPTGWVDIQYKNEK